MPRHLTKITLSFAMSAALLGCAVPTPIGTSSATPAFVYTGNEGDVVVSSSLAGNQYSGNLSGYSVDSTSGALTPLSGFPLTLNTGATSPLILTHDAQNRFVIAVDTELLAIRVLAVNATTGALTEVPTSPYVPSLAPTSAVTDPTGQYLYVSSNVSAMQAFSLSSVGALTPLPGGAVPLGGKAFLSGTSINALHMNADGSFLYYANGSQMAVYSVNSSNGTVALVQKISNSAANDEGGFVFDPAGKYLYAMSDSSSYLLTYSIDPITGLLTQADQNTLLVETLGYSTLTITPNGKFAYTIENGNTLVSYAVNNGVFTPIGTPLTGYNSGQLLVNATGSFLYAPASCVDCASPATNSGVDQFAIGSNGLLTPLSPATVPSGVLPFGITMVSP